MEVKKAPKSVFKAETIEVQNSQTYQVFMEIEEPNFFVFVI